MYTKKHLKIVGIGDIESHIIPNLDNLELTNPDWGGSNAVEEGDRIHILELADNPTYKGEELFAEIVHCEYIKKGFVQVSLIEISKREYTGETPYWEDNRNGNEVLYH